MLLVHGSNKRVQGYTTFCHSFLLVYFKQILPTIENFQREHFRDKIFIPNGDLKTLYLHTHTQTHKFTDFLIFLHFPFKFNISFLSKSFMTILLFFSSIFQCEKDSIIAIFIGRSR